MNGLINFEDYLSSVEAELATLDIFKTVGIWGEIKDGYETPAIFFEIERWEEADNVNFGGNLTVQLTCNFYIVREFAAEEYNRKLRNLALAFTGWIHGRTFGPGTGPVNFISAEPGGFYQDEKALSSHHVWSVTVEQCVAAGIDPFDDSCAPLLKEVWLGISPDVGAGHKDDYTLLAKSGES
ncbi:hypothetical protein MUU49_07225 [Scandinavium goeteborgense]|uniref:hypothetical protein n=1 Tax=Scandinavium goeteborgense TaxID=1851514 RepID=UPI0021658FCC|nr:hypothetical protein [Scandinavium goeteborgense]MCS2152374.1 hypothetical protein [Scandinavium goeteborgense]